MLFSKNDKEKASIDSFLKSRKENNKMLYATGAKYFHMWAKDGRGEYLNYLFANLEPIDQTGMRIYFANRLIDLFGVGGVRKPDDETKWLIRPHSFFTITLNPPATADGKDENGTPIHFNFVPFKDKDAKGDNPSKNRPAWLKNLAPVDAERAIANMKAMRKNCVDAGVDGLTFEWLKRDDAERIQGPADITDAADKMLRSIVYTAKVCAAAGLSEAIIDRIVDACPSDWFSTKDRMKIAEPFAGAKAAAAKAKQVTTTEKPKEEPKESESATPLVNPQVAAESMAAMAAAGQEPAH